jgi:hypothetical protein
VSDYGKSLEKAFKAWTIIVIAVSAVGGWAVIEGLIWLLSNVSISIT